MVHALRNPRDLSHCRPNEGDVQAHHIEEKSQETGPSSQAHLGGCGCQARDRVEIRPADAHVIH